jgi:CLASP N terminal
MLSSLFPEGAMNSSLTADHAVLSRGVRAEWNARVRALRSLRNLACRQNADLRAALGLFGPPLAAAVGDLRSAVVKESCVCIEELATAYGPEFSRATSEVLIPSLLRASAVSVTFLSTAALNAIQKTVQEGGLGVTKRSVILMANSVMNTISDLKHPMSRQAAASCLGLLLNDDNMRNLPPAALEAIEDAIRSGCADSSLNVRTESRANWRKLELVDPVRAATLLIKLPEPIQVLVLQEKDIASMSNYCSPTRDCIESSAPTHKMFRKADNNIQVRGPQRTSLAQGIASPLLAPSPKPPKSHTLAPRRASIAQPTSGTPVVASPTKARAKPPPAPRRLPVKSGNLTTIAEGSVSSPDMYTRLRPQVRSNPFAHRPPRRSVAPMQITAHLNEIENIPPNSRNGLNNLTDNLVQHDSGCVLDLGEGEPNEVRDVCSTNALQAPVKATDNHFTKAVSCVRNQIDAEPVEILQFEENQDAPCFNNELDREPGERLQDPHIIDSPCFVDEIDGKPTESMAPEFQTSRRILNPEVSERCPGPVTLHHHSIDTSPRQTNGNSLRKARISFILGPNISPQRNCFSEVSRFS